MIIILILHYITLGTTDNLPTSLISRITIEIVLLDRPYLSEYDNNTLQPFLLLHKACTDDVSLLTRK